MIWLLLKRGVEFLAAVLRSYPEGDFRACDFLNTHRVRYLPVVEGYYSRQLAQQFDKEISWPLTSGIQSLLAARQILRKTLGSLFCWLNPAPYVVPQYRCHLDIFTS